jgi:hypothetical protein
MLEHKCLDTESVDVIFTIIVMLAESHVLYVRCQLRDHKHTGDAYQEHFIWKKLH